MEILSNCCNAPILGENENYICSMCKEPCDIENDEDESFSEKAEKDQREYYESTRGV
jgi:hypothetical protein